VWQCASLSPSPPGLPLRFILEAPGGGPPNTSLVDVTASNVFLTASGVRLPLPHQPRHCRVGSVLYVEAWYT